MATQTEQAEHYKGLDQGTAPGAFQFTANRVPDRPALRTLDGSLELTWGEYNDAVRKTAAGWEFADLGGRHHAGGGSHGSLLEGDSVVPLLTVGIDTAAERITDVMPAVLSHFGVEPPSYTHALQHVA